MGLEMVSVVKQHKSQGGIDINSLFYKEECDGSISIDEGNAAIRDHHQYARQKYSVYHPQCYSWLYLKRCNFGFYQPRCGEKPPSYF
ncbi:hypothetical protein L2E82_50232 [Cichorium intybus]|nr:hypothetical protein L2E82_50232 [Cichorium intybus]